MMGSVDTAFAATARPHLTEPNHRASLCSSRITTQNSFANTFTKMHKATVRKFLLKHFQATNKTGNKDSDSAAQQRLHHFSFPTT